MLLSFCTTCKLWTTIQGCPFAVRVQLKLIGIGTWQESGREFLTVGQGGPNPKYISSQYNRGVLRGKKHIFPDIPWNLKNKTISLGYLDIPHMPICQSISHISWLSILWIRYLRLGRPVYMGTSQKHWALAQLVKAGWVGQCNLQWQKCNYAL